jgi:hypothetical protein
MPPGPSATPRLSAARTLLFGTLAMGTLDILWAIGNAALNGRGAVWVFQTIAGGIYHRATYEGGLRTALLGMGIHYFISGSVVTFYYLVSRRVGLLVDRPWVAGPIYGLGVYLFMQLVVLPLAKWGGGLTPGIGMVKGVFIHMACVGLVTALIVSRGPRPAGS